MENVNLRYLCWGEEVGAEGTPHLQGYAVSTNARTLSAMKKVLGSSRLHLQKSKGSGKQNVDYCKKIDAKSVANGVLPNLVFHCYGDLPQQGKRSDLDEVKELIEDGATEAQIAQEFFGQWVRYRVGFREYRSLMNRPMASSIYPLDSFPLEWRQATFNWDKTLIFWGASGVGKTEFACALLPGALMVSHMDDLKQFDEEYHSGIIFDDVDIKHIPRTAQIHLVDQQHCRSIHIRYGCATIPAHTKKIFTTNEEGGNCMSLEDSAIKRRVKVHKFMK